MNHPSDKTLSDLEFDVLLNQVQSLAKTDAGSQAIAEIKPFSDASLLLDELKRTEEFSRSFESENRIPNHEFESIDTELKRLRIANYVLDIRSFQKIAALNKTTNELIRFFDDFKIFYQHLHIFSKKEYFNLSIIEKIERVIDRFGNVKDDASAVLFELRKRLNQVRGQINNSFQKALSQYAGLGYLDDIKETVVDNRRVLAVLAMHKKQVSGKVLGVSKTGSIVYVQPQQTYAYETELSHLEHDESEEIRRILAQLTQTIKPEAGYLTEIQQYLTQIDVISAKALYAKKINAVLPQINKTDTVYLIDAFHPLLFLSHQAKKIPTYPQSFSLDAENRILVISGPNAGGKSITLKTLGLLQLMLQSGMLIPVKSASSTCLFKEILTDIGDNQSIDNHLSTYSYRLKNMRRFLKRCKQNTLFLIDEFGSGTDPELGGALAEVFLEEFYQRGAYGIITTHYANLKRMADEWPGISNANMVFDHQSLNPTFHLQLGEAGSSYTFEVAQKNGIPFSLINRAKKKVEKGKINFDNSIAKLQKEKLKFSKEREKLEYEARHQAEINRQNEQIQLRIQEKLENYQTLFDSHQQLIQTGKKMKELAENYRTNKRKKNLIEGFLKWVETENAKKNEQLKLQKEQKTDQPSKAKPVRKPDEKKILKEIEPELNKIRERKKIEKIQKSTENQPPAIVRPNRVGDRVRMESGKAVGTIDKIEKETATVNYGHFTTLVKLNQLELVQKVK